LNPIDRALLARRLPAAALLALLALVAGPVQARVLGEIEFEPCVLTTAGLPRPTEAQCATIEVPENPADPDGRRIELALAWIPVEGESEPDPVFMIAGGPGQSARDTYPAVSHAFGDINRSRHVLLLDQRGTGGSNPLFCHDEDEFEGLLGLESLSPEQVLEETQRCLDRLENVADLRYYTTTEAVFDLEYVRRALGAPQVNLVAVSYGTRVAQQYAATHPEQVRSLILDGLVPNSLVLGAEHARNLQDALETHFNRCRETPACIDNLGDPSLRLEEISTRLKAGGLEPVRYRDPSTGEWREETPTWEHFAGILRMYAYSPLSAAVIPLVMHQVAEGDYTALLAMTRMLVQDLSGQMSPGMHNSVICTEDADELEQAAGDEETVMGAMLVEFMQAQCDLWPRGTRPAGFREPLTGDFPVLLVSGEYDPVTPPRYGDEVAGHLSNARHLVLPGQGHSLLVAGCMPKLAAQFIEDADPRGLDAGCIDRLAAPPPFSGMHGWEP
jgi:pimeloyl-ACP methyl ester carboxylesterase